MSNEHNDTCPETITRGCRDMRTGWDRFCNWLKDKMLTISKHIRESNAKLAACNCFDRINMDDDCFRSLRRTDREAESREIDQEIEMGIRDDVRLNFYHIDMEKISDEMDRDEVPTTPVNNCLIQVSTVGVVSISPESARAHEHEEEMRAKTKATTVISDLKSVSIESDSDNSSVDRMMEISLDRDPGESKNKIDNENNSDNFDCSIKEDIETYNMNSKHRSRVNHVPDSDEEDNMYRSFGSHSSSYTYTSDSGYSTGSTYSEDFYIKDKKNPAKVGPVNVVVAKREEKEEEKEDVSESNVTNTTAGTDDSVPDEFSADVTMKTDNEKFVDNLKRNLEVLATLRKGDKLWINDKDQTVELDRTVWPLQVAFRKGYGQSKAKTLEFIQRIVDTAKLYEDDEHKGMLLAAKIGIKNIRDTYKDQPWFGKYKEVDGIDSILRDMGWKSSDDEEMEYGSE